MFFSGICLLTSSWQEVNHSRITVLLGKSKRRVLFSNKEEGGKTGAWKRFGVITLFVLHGDISFDTPVVEA